MQYRQTSRRLLSLLGGAGVGAALMYFLDPDVGYKRRRRFGESATGAMHDAGDRLGSAWSSARHAAGQYVPAAAMSGLGTSLASKLSQATGRVRRADIRGTMSHALDRGRAWWREEEADRSTVGDVLFKGVLVVGCFALGAGLMYALDPASGRRRRAVAQDKLRSAAGRTGQYLQRTGQDLRNRAHGMTASIRGRMHYEEVADDKLVERVRADLGHGTSRAQDIHVAASGGTVTVRGSIPASEIDTVLKCVWKTRGVKEIVNELMPSDQPVAEGTQGS